MTKIIETTENVRKTAINNLFEAALECAKTPRNDDIISDKMNNTAIGLHQIGINLETIQSEKDELIEALIESSKLICSNCNDSDYCLASDEDCCKEYSGISTAIEKHTGKSIEELLK